MQDYNIVFTINLTRLPPNVSPPLHGTPKRTQKSIHIEGCAKHNWSWSIIESMVNDFMLYVRGLL